MKLPFLLSKVYQTTNSQAEVINLINSLINQQNKALFENSSEYIASIKKLKFKFFTNSYILSGFPKPNISGSIKLSNPTTISIIIYPNFYRALFFLIWPIVAIPFAFSGPMNVNGVFRDLSISERIPFFLFIILPILGGYFDSISSIKKAEIWIKNRLNLTDSLI